MPPVKPRRRRRDRQYRPSSARCLRSAPACPVPAPATPFHSTHCGRCSGSSPLCRRQVADRPAPHLPRPGAGRWRRRSHNRHRSADHMSSTSSGSRRSRACPAALPHGVDPGWRADTGHTTRARRTGRLRRVVQARPCMPPASACRRLKPILEMQRLVAERAHVGGAYVQQMVVVASGIGHTPGKILRARSHSRTGWSAGRLPQRAAGPRWCRRSPRRSPRWDACRRVAPPPSASGNSLQGYQRVNRMAGLAPIPRSPTASHPEAPWLLASNCLAFARHRRRA